VGGGDSPDDGQPEAVPVGPGRARAQAPERLEQAIGLSGLDHRPGVGDRQNGAGAAGRRGDLDVSPRQVVPDGVLDQVARQLLNQERVAVEGSGQQVGVDLQAELADRGTGGGQDSAGDGGQVDGLALVDAGFTAGQGEQRFDEALLLSVGGEQFPADGLPGLEGGIRIGQGDLEQSAFPGQGSAQLMRGVRGETLLGAEGGFQPPEQPVKGVGEFLELVIRSAQCQPLVQAPGRDPAGGGGNRAQRVQHPPGQQPADHGGYHHEDPQRDRGGDEQHLAVEGDLSASGVERLPRRLLDDTADIRSRNARAGRVAARGDTEHRVRRLPEQQVRQGQHRRAASQERQAVHDGKAQPGGAAGESH
jgi:hypothetical protein